MHFHFINAGARGLFVTYSCDGQEWSYKSRDHIHWETQGQPSSTRIDPQFLAVLQALAKLVQ